MNFYIFASVFLLVMGLLNYYTWRRRKTDAKI